MITFKINNAIVAQTYTVTLYAIERKTKERTEISNRMHWFEENYMQDFSGRGITHEIYDFEFCIETESKGL